MSAFAPSLTGLPPLVQPAQPVDTIRALLRREVASILKEAMPVLALVPPDKVYDHVMSDPILLEQAFRVLRSQPELFKDIITTPQRNMPQSDEESLWCGRTLAEAIALVVRACARRYFKQRLKTPKFRPLRQPSVGFWRSLGIALGVSEPARPLRRKPAIGAGDKLYAAMRDLLRYEWQVPLIPAYSTLSPQLVTSLGEKLLEFRDPLKVQLLSDYSTESALVDGKLPLLLSDAHRLMTAASDNINAEVLWNVCQKMRMAALFPGHDTAEMRKAVSLVAATSPAALKIMLPVLGDDIRKFTLYLFTVYGKFGPARYRQVLGAQCQSWVVEGMAKRVAKEPPLTGTHEEMKRTIESWLDSTLETVVTDEGQRTDMLGALDGVADKTTK
ncbi:hypothetical protein [Magnetospirillum sulfuroxidans]|uniref:Uncharacterized protein n=1 Tax=Magnetospirillum sulfuroxidans TaxID=611300 RepID=A0ABS5IFA3_9PROT|nr:hypothetical protein [Magnetospirillum sulfuroxidans]MBR9972408.1 hypothetical protein [Magnetospirillum sulfuroxidans]